MKVHNFNIKIIIVMKIHDYDNLFSYKKCIINPGTINAVIMFIINIYRSIEYQWTLLSFVIRTKAKYTHERKKSQKLPSYINNFMQENKLPC